MLVLAGAYVQHPETDLQAHLLILITVDYCLTGTKKCDRTVQIQPA